MRDLFLIFEFGEKSLSVILSLRTHPIKPKTNENLIEIELVVISSNRWGCRDVHAGNGKREEVEVF